MTTTFQQQYPIGSRISGIFSKLPFAGVVSAHLAECVVVALENPHRNLPVGSNLTFHSTDSNVTIDQSEPITVADILDQLVIAVEVARVKAADTAWQNAVEAGYDWLLTQDTITYDRTHCELTIESASEPGTFWRANGECGCPAGRRSGICYHRSAARLVRRALELSATASRPKHKPNAAERAKAFADVQELWA
jgi:hypothetical protein